MHSLWRQEDGPIEVLDRFVEAALLERGVALFLALGCLQKGNNENHLTKCRWRSGRLSDARLVAEQRSEQCMENGWMAT